MLGIAVTGLDCAFPGAADPEEFWRLLGHGRQAVGPPSPARGDGRRGERPAGYLDDADAFDHAFFGIDAAEAQAMDPRQRLLLQCVWRALEDAGTPPAALAGTQVGVYTGTMTDDWTALQLADPATVSARTGTGTGHAMLANRLSYQLDLRGPSLTVDTACSSSLVAVHLACTALLAGECDHAVAAGVNVLLTAALDAVYARSGLAAPDGRCKPFSPAADGIGRAEGVGAVVLRRLEDALAEGRPVYAVIRGSAINQDGRSNGMTAPSRGAQREVITAACHRAGVRPAEVAFVEAHGTGTRLGDLIELGALGDTYGAEDRELPCHVGSLKGNIGHAEGAAGIAGLIKAVLALHHRTLPPGYAAGDDTPGPGPERAGLCLPDRPVPLPPRGQLLAGVSSFGMGGSNAHVVLGTAPERPFAPPASDAVPRVFTLSADSAAGLQRNLLVQSEALPDVPRSAFAAACWTSNTVRTRLPYRFAAVATDPAAVARELRAAALDADVFGHSDRFARPDGPPSVALLFTGQGSQYPAMGAGLYAAVPSYRRHFDAAAAALDPHLDHSVAESVLSGDERVDRTERAQPALFAVGYALAGMVADLGVRPVAVLGHSSGEYAAACAAGALTLPDAARLVARRARLMGALPAGGAMLAARCRPEDARELVRGTATVALAAVNGPRAVVLSGSRTELAAIQGELTAGKVGSRWLPVSHAAHSPLVEPMREPFARAAAEVPGKVPTVPFHSTVHGRRCGDSEALDGAYWADHLTAPVRFADALRGLYRAHRPTHLVEIGPRPVLAPLAHRLVPLPKEACRHACQGPESTGGEAAELAAALYRSGLDPDWAALYAPVERTPHRLRPHAFATAARFWARPETTPRPAAPPPVPSAAPPDGPEAMLDTVLATTAAVLGREPSDVPADARFYEDLGFDSVMIMELRHRIEQSFPALAAVPLSELLDGVTDPRGLAEHLRLRCSGVRA
ncbi:type I polyketide synthase [Streptomyces sp. NPDC039016]|uniref:type I polyketide synthase n=1 Tax=Streptomyces sp. NPDC039016 TaxID=3154330 RepID=UPI0033CAE857